MAEYRYKEADALAYNAFKKRLRVEAQIAVDALLNDALAEGTRQFNEALLNGGVPQIEVNQDSIRALLLDAAKRELGPGSDV